MIFRIKQAITDLCFIFVQELKNVFKDEGVLIFFILVPLGYPLLYGWIYNNEGIKDVPTAFVDDSHSFLSREFIRKCDATDGIKTIAVCPNIEDAKEMQRRQECHGIVYIPSDFGTKINLKEQTNVKFFADMSGMLYYKAIFAALTDVSLEMGKEIQISRSTDFTKRDNELTTAPIHMEAVQIFNPQGGYGSFLLPAVLVLIIQQTLLLGIGLSAGTARESNRYNELVPVKRHNSGMFRIVFGKSLCYFSIYLLVTLWIVLVVPRIFDYIQLAHARELIGILLPYILASIFFGMTLSCMVRYRENVMLLVLFTSVPLLFLSGVSWPGSAISGIWKGISYLFPSTFGINAFVKINTFGASLEDVKFEYQALWIQAALYFFLACIVYWRQINIARKGNISRRQSERQQALSAKSKTE